MKKFSEITTAQFAAMAWPGTGKTLHVDATNGSNSKGARGKHLAFATITAAKAAAVSGDTIIVHPGTYTETDLLKNGVNMHFHAGAIVVNDVSSTTIKNGTAATKAIFDDSGAAVTARITGDGEFRVLFGTPDRTDDVIQWLEVPTNANRRAFINISHASTDLSVQFDRATYSGFSSTGIQMIYVVNCARCDITGRSLDTLNTAINYDIGGAPYGPTLVSDSFGGIWWAQGETYINIEIIKSGLYAIYPEGTGVSGETNLWVSARLVEAYNFAPFYANGAANANYKVWLTVDEIRHPYGGNTFNIQCNGKIYIEAKKMGALAGGKVFDIQAASATGLTLWIKSQKMTGAGSAGAQELITIGGTNNFPVTAYVDVEHFEELVDGSSAGSTFGTIRVRGTSTKAVIRDGTVVTRQNRYGFQHDAGTTHLANMRIESNATNDADNKCVIATGAGLTLDNCTLIAPVLGYAFFASTVQAVTFVGETLLSGQYSGVNVPIDLRNCLEKRVAYAYCNGSSGTINCLGDVLTTNGTGTATAPTASEGCTDNYASAASTNSQAGYGGNLNYRVGRNIEFRNKVKLQENTAEIAWIVLSDQTFTTATFNDNPAGNYAGFRYSTNAGDSTWKAITKDGTTQSVTDTGVSVNTAIRKFEVIEDVANARWLFKIDDILVASKSTNLPTAGTNLRPCVGVTTLENVAKNIRVESVEIRSDR